VIAAADRIELAPGVHLRGRALIDEVRGVSVPLNATAALALRESTPERMARRLCDLHDVDRVRASDDVRFLCLTLNSALLVNVRVATPRLLIRWLRHALMLAPLRRLPSWPPCRHVVRTTSTAGAITTVARGAACAAAAVGVATAAPFVAVGAPAIGLAAGTAAAGGLVLHEAAHAVALRGTAAALIVRGVRVALLHRRLSPAREAVVAAAGPLAVVAASFVVLAAAHAGSAPGAAPVPLVLALHALGLTALAPDGRKICVAC
jgi:hypothetical protein